MKPKQPRKYASERKPDQTNPITNHWVLSKEPYRTGDGDVVAMRRPGSDHSKYKSFGFRT